MDCLFLLLWTLQVPLVNSASMRLMASVSFGNFIKASDIMKRFVMFVFFEALIHKLMSCWIACVFAGFAVLLHSLCVIGVIERCHRSSLSRFVIYHTVIRLYLFSVLRDDKPVVDACTRSRSGSHQKLRSIIWRTMHYVAFLATCRQTKRKNMLHVLRVYDKYSHRYEVARALYVDTEFPSGYMCCIYVIIYNFSIYL